LLERGALRREAHCTLIEFDDSIEMVRYIRDFISGWME
jgi:hypothetical protein